MGQIIDHHHQPHLFGSPCSSSSSSSSSRLDILDELCRPLAERVRFHFLEEKSGGLMSNNGAASKMTSLRETLDENEDSMAPPHHHHHHHQTSNFERLPEWLFQYLREVVQDHGVYSLAVLEGVQPLMNSVIESLIVRATAAATKVDISEEEGDGKNYSTIVASENAHIHMGIIDDDDCDNVLPKSSSTPKILHTLKRQYYNHAPTYFLREVARMARHVLRAKSYFHHPDVVGSACRDRAVVLRGIEQLFLFDEFLVNKIQLLGGGR
ncbi:hypothetical protein ACHAXH_002093 [Discostella pseudostelligera]